MCSQKAGMFELKHSGIQIFFFSEIKGVQMTILLLLFNFIIDSQNYLHEHYYKEQLKLHFLKDI